MLNREVDEVLISLPPRAIDISSPVLPKPLQSNITDLNSSNKHHKPGPAIRNWGDKSVPVACRLVSSDQWLKTHVHSAWTIRHTKVYLLAKFDNPSAPFFAESNPSPATPCQTESQPKLNPSPMFREPGRVKIENVLESSKRGIRRQSGNSNGSFSSAEMVFKANSDDENDDRLPSPVDAVPKRLPRRPAHPARQNSGTSSIRGIEPHQSGDRHSLRGYISPTTTASPSMTTPVLDSPLDFQRGPIPSPSVEGPDPFRKAKFDHQLKVKSAQLKADEYELCSFSTGQSLEDHMPFSSYHVRPFELLVIQRRHRHAALSLEDYTLPYFDVPAQVHITQEKVSAGRSQQDSEFNPRPSPLEIQRFNISKPAVSDSAISGPSTPVTADPVIMLPTPQEKPSPPEPRRQPYRSHSAHFRPSSADRSRTNYDGNFLDEQDRWKGKERMRDAFDPHTAGLLPPAVTDGVVVPSLPGIGREDHKDAQQGKRKARRRAEKEAKGAWESLSKSENWKSRWLFIRDGRLYLWKDRSFNLSSPVQFDLAAIISVSEAPLPQQLLTPDGRNIHSTCVVVRLKHYYRDLSLSGRSNRDDRMSSVVTVIRVRPLDPKLHEHLLRVLCRLHSSVSERTAYEKRRVKKPPPTSFPTNPTFGSLGKVAHNDSPGVDKKLLSKGVHRNSLSLSSDSHSDVAPAISSLETQLHDLQGHSNQKQEGSDQQSRFNPSLHTANLRSWDSGDGESLRSFSPSSAPASPTSGGVASHRISLFAAINMGPPSKSKPKPLYLRQREQLIKRCVVAGKGEAHLRKGSPGTPSGPWQRQSGGGFALTVSDEESDAGSANDQWESDYEWTRWRHDEQYSSPNMSIDLAPDDRLPIGLNATLSEDVSTDFGEVYDRRGSVPLLGLGMRSAPSPSPPSSRRNVGIKSSMFPGVLNVGSIADAMTGRSRSKSVATILTSSPTAEIPSLTASQELYPTSPMPIASSVNSPTSLVFTSQDPFRSASSLSSGRHRSSTIGLSSPTSWLRDGGSRLDPLDPLMSSPIQEENGSSSRPRQPSKPQVLATRPEGEESDNSDLSLNSALRLGRPSTTSPSPHSTTTSPQLSQSGFRSGTRSRTMTIDSTRSSSVLTSGAVLAAISSLNPAGAMITGRTSSRPKSAGPHMEPDAVQSTATSSVPVIDGILPKAKHPHKYRIPKRSKTADQKS